MIDLHGPVNVEGRSRTAAHHSMTEADVVHPTTDTLLSDRDREVAAELVAGWPMARPAVLSGTAAIVAGGLVAAVSRPTSFGLGPWVAAFLVLVAGVAQIGLGVGQAWLSTTPPPPRRRHLQVAAWNGGAAGTILGTLTANPVVTTASGLVLALALVSYGLGVRSAPHARRRVARIYRGLVVFVVASIPVGLALAWLRHR